MLVRVVRSFVGKLPNGETFVGSMGAVVDLPPGTDWLAAGFVVPVEDGPESAMAQPAEDAMRRPAKPRPSMAEKRTADDGLEDLTVDELMEMAQDADISGRSSMNKAELIAALRAYFADEGDG